MKHKFKSKASGWIIAHPDGTIITAGASQAAAANRAGVGEEGIVEGSPYTKPQGAYTLYPCDADLLDYFKLRNPLPLPWVDIDFVDGVAIMRISRSGTSQGTYRSITARPHAYHRIRTLAAGRRVAVMLDEIVDYYIANHPDRLVPASATTTLYLRDGQAMEEVAESLLKIVGAGYQSTLSALNKLPDGDRKTWITTILMPASKLLRDAEDALKRPPEYRDPESAAVILCQALWDINPARGKLGLEMIDNPFGGRSMVTPAVSRVFGTDPFRDITDEVH